MNYKIRKATINDLLILLKYEQGVIEAERPMDPTIKSGKIHYYDIKKLITSKKVFLVVAEYNDSIVACGYAKLKKDRQYLKHKLQGYLGFMFVTKEHRGKGVNQLIVDALTDWCIQKEVYEIRLDVYDTNFPAIKAYEKAGFKKHLICMRMDVNPKN